MYNNKKTKLTLLICLIICFTWHTAVQGDRLPTPVPILISETYTGHYTYETINVPGVDFLEVTASNDHGHYAGNTKNRDGKLIGFILVNGILSTYDVPDSRQTTFYGLNNVGQAAGFYIDQNEISHGIILQDGALRVWDFPGALNTQIFGIGAAGQLLGDIIDAEGVINGFIGEKQFDVPGAVTTFVDDINTEGVIVGSYIDANEKYHGFIRYPNGTITDIDIPGNPNLEYLFVNAINDAGVIVFRAKAVGDIERSYVLPPNRAPLELRYPGSVETVLRDIDSEGRITGYYDMPDGRRHGCVISPASQTEAERYGNVYTTSLTKGLNMLSVPLASPRPMTAKSLAGITGATVVITLDAESQSFIAWTPNAPNDGFQIVGGKGYIVNVPEARDFAFVGSRWTNQTESTAAAPTTPKKQQTWAFVVSGHLKGKQTFDGYRVRARNLRTNAIITVPVKEDYFAAATVDLTRQNVVEVGDVIEVHVIGSTGNVESQTFSIKVTPDNLLNAVLTVNLDSIGQPTQNKLLQNYPNPFNPETWIPYQLSQDSPVSISIYGTTGELIRTLSLGFQSAGFYNSRERAAYWDGRNALGEKVASGVYFYKLETLSFQQTRRLVIVK